jgi:hypothetical protein
MSIIEVNISYKNKDIKQAISYIVNHIHKLWVALLCFIIVILEMIIYGFINEVTDYNIGLILVFLFAALIFYGYYFKRPVNGYLKYYEKRKGGQYFFSEDNIKAIGEDIQSTFCWSLFKKAYSIPSAFLFYADNNFIYVFPKRCFINNKDIEQLENLIQKSIKVYKKYN